MRILLTGASGLLGANFLLTALKQGHELLAVTGTQAMNLPAGQHLQVDLVEEQAVARLLQETQPDWIVHCAAITHVDRCEENPRQAYAVNAKATRSLAAGARRLGARMLYVSTDSVFDGLRGRYTEHDTPAPVNVYARTKMAGERAAQEELSEILIVRTNMYGWNAQDKHSLAEWVLARLTVGEDVPGFRDVIFSPILVTDLSEIMLHLMDRGARGVYHVGGGQILSKYAFAVAVAQAFGFPPERVRATSVHEASLAARRPLNTSLSTEKLCRELGTVLDTIDSSLRRLKAQQESGYQQTLKSLIRHV